MEHELTGLEEHLRDEAWECGELAARRREAEQELLSEQAQYEAELEDWRLAQGFACMTGAPSCVGRARAECVDLPF